MLKIENTDVVGWEAAIRGMRNPKNSWEKSDSFVCREYSLDDCDDHLAECKKCPKNKHCDVYDSKAHFIVGNNDHTLMMQLRNAGADHRKFMRMIAVYVDITAPLYWWKEFKTYRAGRRFADDEPDIIDDGYLEYDIEMNSCSTMHKIADKEFTLEDFSYDHLTVESITFGLEPVIDLLNKNRELYLQWIGAGEDKKNLWWQMIQLLPSSYNQRRTVMLNYEVLANMYRSRRHHKLDEWHTFCEWIRTLPYSEIITGEEADK